MVSASSVCAAVAVLVAGCAHRPAEFPIGLYDVPRENFAEVAAAGFNVVTSSASPEALRDAQRHGLKILASPGPASRTREEEQRLRELDRDPALWGWYLIDEPDLHRISPAQVNTDRLRLKSLVRKPAVVVLSSGSAAEKYASSADILGVDFYPIPWAPLATFGREMHLARLGDPKRNFFAILQAFDWSAFPELLRTDASLREPTPEEIRCMAYLALMQGARGIFFYAYQTPTWNLAAHQRLWSAVTNLARELRERAPIFSQRVEWWPAQTRYAGSPAQMYNAIYEARVALALFKVDQPKPGAKPGYYLVAANTTDTPADFSFKVPFRDVTQISTFCTRNEFVAEDGWIQKTYEPFEVCVFGPIDAKLTDN